MSTQARSGGAGDDPLSREIDAALDGMRLQELDAPGERAKKSAGGRELKKGVIVGTSGDDVFVELGPRMQGVISRKEFDEPPKVGAVFEFTLHGREEELWVLSRRAAQEISAAEEIEVGAKVKARVTGQNTGGLELRIGPLAAFMPHSQIGARSEEASALLGQTIVCVVLEIDRDRKRVLLSRRAVLDEEKAEARKESVGKLSTGQVLKGKVTRVEPFGAFVDLGGGLEGLVHVSNLSRRRVESAKEVLSPGQQVDVQVLEIKDGGQRIGLGMKQLEADPWQEAERRYTPDTVVKGKVTRLAEFGAFVELEPGLEGLLHVSQLAKDRVRRPGDVVKVGQELSVRIVGVEPSRSRISLSRLDPRGAVLGSEEAVDASVIDQELAKNSPKNLGTNLGSIFKRALDDKKK